MLHKCLVLKSRGENELIIVSFVLRKTVNLCGGEVFGQR